MSEDIFLAIDHVVIRAADTQLFELLSGPLGLPIAWPLQVASFATFGWIGVGNTHLEIWAAADNADLPDGCPLPCIQQIALAPQNLEKSVALLEAAGLQCKTPRAYQTKNDQGDLQTNFTNSVVLDLSSATCCVFFCDWNPHAPIVPWKQGLTALERKQHSQAALSACGGGPLGLVGLRQIAVLTTTLERSAAPWRTLTGTEHSPFCLTPEIALHLWEGSHDGIESLTFAVRDLSQASRFLRSNGLLDVHPEGVVALAAAATKGVAIRFVLA